MARPLVVPDRRAQRIQWLRKKFAEHNRLVVLVALLTLLVTVGIWYLLFAVLYWLTFLFATVVRGSEARPPESLPALFIYSAALLLWFAWLLRKRFANEMPKDEKSPWEIAMEFLLAIPRATLAIWGNISAWQRLDPRELALAANLLETLENEGRIPIHQIPLDLPDPEDRLRILLALQLMEVINVIHSDQTVWVSLRQEKGITANK